MDGRFSEFFCHRCIGDLIILLYCEVNVLYLPAVVFRNLFLNTSLH